MMDMREFHPRFLMNNLKSKYCRFSVCICPEVFDGTNLVNELPAELLNYAYSNSGLLHKIVPNDTSKPAVAIFANGVKCVVFAALIPTYGC